MSERNGQLLGLAAGGVLVAVGIALTRKKGILPAGGAHIGDTVTLTALGFTYQGPAQDLFVGWGLARSGDLPGTTAPYQNGAGLVGGRFGAGGPIVVPVSPDPRVVRLNPDLTLADKPRLTLEEGVFALGRHQCFVWISVGGVSELEMNHIGRDVGVFGVTIVEG